MGKTAKIPFALALPVLLTLVAARPAAAEVEAGSQMLSGFVGAHLFDVGDEFDNRGASFNTEVDLGARYEYNFTAHWGVEGSFLYSPGNTELARRGLSDADVDAYYYNGNVVYHILPERRLVPFATAGIGGVSLDVSGGNTESFFTFNFGGGVLYSVNHRWAVRFDARDYVYNADGLGSRTIDRLGLRTGFDETIHDLSLNGGITLFF